MLDFIHKHTRRYQHTQTLLYRDMELHLILTIALSKRGCGPLLLMREQAQGGEDIDLEHRGRKHKEVVKYVCSGVTGPDQSLSFFSYKYCGPQ